MKFLKKHQPKQLSDMIGQDIPIRKLMHCLKEEATVMLYGKTGAGKTTALRLLANETGREIVEIGPLESKSTLERILPAVRQTGLSGKKKIVVVESAGRIRGPVLARIMDESVFPVVLVVDNPYNPKFSKIRRKCELIEFRGVSQPLLEDMLMKICSAENLGLSRADIRNIAGSAAGDVRAAVMDLEAGPGARDRESNIFETLRTLFKSGNVRTALEAIRSSEKDAETVVLWVEENIANEFADPNDRARALEILSNADLYRRRTKRFVEMLAGITTVRPSRGLTRYRPASAYFFRRNIDNTEEIAGEMHCSKRTVKREMPYLRSFLS